MWENRKCQISSSTSRKPCYDDTTAAKKAALLNILAIKIDNIGKGESRFTGFDVVTEPEPLAPMQNNQSGGIPVTEPHIQSQAQPAKLSRKIVMKLIHAFIVVLFSGLAQAAQPGKTPSDADPIHEQEAPNGRWVEYRYRPNGVTTANLIAGGEKLGGFCHKLSVEEVVVCYYDNDKSVAAYRALGKDQLPEVPGK